MSMTDEVMKKLDEGSVTNRRRFLFTAAGLFGAAAVWKLKGMPHAEAATPAGPVTIIRFDDSGKSLGKATVQRVVKTDAEWKAQLSPISYEVARHEGTERAYSGATWNVHDKGLFRCVCCDNAVFDSATKFDSGTGWPSFWQPIAKQNILEISDSSLGMERTAVACKECNAHLGHVFDDGPQPTGLRYCMNSASMRFVKHA
jgi:peptide-methionine (R)-S-oxide reductase